MHRLKDFTMDRLSAMRGLSRAGRRSEDERYAKWHAEVNDPIKRIDILDTGKFDCDGLEYRFHTKDYIKLHRKQKYVFQFFFLNSIQEVSGIIDAWKRMSSFENLPIESPGCDYYNFLPGCTPAFNLGTTIISDTLGTFPEALDYWDDVVNNFELEGRDGKTL